MQDSCVISKFWVLESLKAFISNSRERLRLLYLYSLEERHKGRWQMAFLIERPLLGVPSFLETQIKAV